MENMKKYSFWMHPEMIEEIEKALPFSYDDNKSSFVRSAVNFYIGYLMHKQSQQRNQKSGGIFAGLFIGNDIQISS